MQPWNQVLFPDLQIDQMQLQVFDSKTLSYAYLPTSGRPKLYVCGITPYDATHMGHAATYVAFDTLLRIWRTLGADVQYAQNVTDIDDPLLDRAKLTGRSWQEIALEQTELFKSDMMALRVIAPQHYIGVVESMEIIEQSVVRLVELGIAYRVDDDYYFDMTHTDLLGQISHLSMAARLEIFALRGGDPHRLGKRNSFDALLWRAQSGDDPYWPSGLGPGRPGWHIECSAIATRYLGPQITVQGGGSDLKFPHHEMSAAHAESLTGLKPFAGTFMHAGMVALEGEKMSKSLGNLIFVSKLISSGVDPMAIRLAILSHHYRQDWEWFDSELSEATSRLHLWRDAFSVSNDAPNLARDITQDIASALAFDLDTPKAISIIDIWAKETLSSLPRSTDSQHRATASTVSAIDALLGIM